MKFINYAPQEMEPKILDFWQKEKVVEKLRERNKEGKKFYFLQGPPYTSGRIHCGQAWNHALKDMVLRYKRSQGFNVWDRNGYDMHGLPTEHKVMAKHNLKTKEDIEKFGLERFANECLSFSTEMAGHMDNDLKRLGYTLDFTDPYLPVTTGFMEGCWHLVKKAEEKKRLYLGKRTLSWCASCETALAKHECDYKEITDNSIFVKLPLKGKEGEFLIIWTTTPWTIAFNLAVIVNPELDYVKAEVTDPDTGNKEIWYLAKALAGVVVQSVAEKKLQIIEEFKGETMDGWEYVHPWEKDISEYAELKKNHPRVHTVLMSKEHVTTDAGTGLVHCAPGCGPEDYEVGHANNVPPYNNIDGQGMFPENMGVFAGKIAKKDDPFFVEQLKKSGNLIATTPVEHDYAHCQRCNGPIVFRTTPQWFFKVEDLKKKMSKANEGVNWGPQTAKHGFASWLNNLRDNSITKQRFWGTPMPLWKCQNEDCGNYEVFGSVAELKKRVGTESKVPENIHKPFIDEVKFGCAKCQSMMVRDPDVLDVWIDAGTASWNCLNYPHDQKLIEEWFPADFIVEGKDQIRGWFNLLMVASFIALDKVPFKNVYMHGFITDVDGVKMSKSLGNVISPFEVVDKVGADGLRYYMCQNNAGEDINFSWDEAGLKNRYVNILWNSQKLLINLAKENKINPYQLDEKKIKKSLAVEEKYILSKLNSTIKTVTEQMDKYQLDEIVAPIEELFLELSRTYVQMTRDKSSLGTLEDKEVVIYTLGTVILETLKMFSLLAPFACEAIYQNLQEEFGSKTEGVLAEESISHYSWPKVDTKLVNPELETEMGITKSVIQGALNAREKAKLGLRWPVKELVVVSKKKEVVSAVEKLKEIIKTQLNTKEVRVTESLPGVELTLEPNLGKIGPVYGATMPKIVEKLKSIKPETIVDDLAEDNIYKFKLDKQDIRITKDMVKVERKVPEPYKDGEGKSALVYVNIERTDELEAEGYAREIMRNVQQLRKKAGLEKVDEIILHLKVSKNMRDGLEPFQQDIKDKVGAQELKVVSIDPVKKHAHGEEFKVKKEQFSVWFTKV